MSSPERSRRRIRTARALPALCLLAAGLAGCGAPSREAPANVLLVTLDTVRADFLGCYGGDPNVSPNFDRLASQGTRFETTISAAAVTPVSHASILTGLYPYGHRLRVLFADGGYRLPEDVPSLASVLREAGYRTGAVHSSFTVSGYFGFDRGFDLFESFDATLDRRGRFEDWSVRESQRRADATTDIAIRFIEAAPEPFFLWVHYWDMHDTLLLPDKEFMPPTEATDVDAHGVVQPNPVLYAAEIRFVDHHFGRLLGALEASGRDPRTLIVVVADHGEGLGDHGWYFHRLLYQEQIRVPLLLRFPGVAPGGKVDALVRSVDVLPTLLDYLGLDIPVGLHGRSLRPLLEGRGDEPRIAYADQINLFDRNAMMTQGRPTDLLLHSVQDREWKLIYKPLHPRRSELYHLAEDPGETRNLFRTDHPEARSLLAKLALQDVWVKEPPRGDGMDPEAREQLTALGYVGGDEELEWESMRWSYSPAANFGNEFFDSATACEESGQGPCVLIRPRAAGSNRSARGR